MKALLAQFVCVRVVQANAMDLTLFQFDYDLTFAAFFLNADRTIYGRYGTRSSHDSAQDISLDGFRKALVAALELHRGYPANKALLEGKQAKPLEIKTPEQYPSLRGKYKSQLDYTGNVVRSCMHCHQIGVAQRELFRAAKKAMPDDVFFPYPRPEAVGLRLDPAERATVVGVDRTSPTGRAGFEPGDEIVSLAGQPIGSISDIQWVMHTAGDADEFTAEIKRNAKAKRLTLALPDGWRRASDISWRTSTWDLRRMGAGGLLLEDLPDDERAKADLPTTAMALRVKHVGEYGDHAAAKRAGFQKGDIIVELDGQTGRLTESELLAYSVQKKLPGEQVAATVLRDRKRTQLKLPMQ